MTWPHLFTKYCLNNNGLHIEGFLHLKIYETNKLLQHHRKTGSHQESMLPHFQDGFRPKPRCMDIHISHSAQTWSTNYADPYLRWSGHTSSVKAFSKFWTNANQLVQTILDMGSVAHRQLPMPPVQAPFIDSSCLFTTTHSISLQAYKAMSITIISDHKASSRGASRSRWMCIGMHTKKM